MPGPFHVVVIGGGTGSYTILKGLKEWKDRLRITSIVSMADNGGDTGRLRDEFGVLPPGDVRRCLVALSEETELLKRLFDFRFSEGSLAQRSMGNLFLLALERITGSYDQAVREVGKILKICGRVLPVTLDDVHLFAELEDGTVIAGETNIDLPVHDAELKIGRVYLEPRATANPEAIEAIGAADAVIFAPGDLYTSTIPNLLVEGIPEALLAARATRIYVVNLMTKHGQTDAHDVSHHVEAIDRYVGGRAIDVVLVNSRCPPEELLQSYAAERSFPVRHDPERLLALGVTDVVEADVLDRITLVRHDPRKTARVLVDMLGTVRRRAGTAAPGRESA